MEYFLVLILLIVSAVYNMSEMSFVLAKRYKLNNAYKKGSKGAKIAMDLADDPNTLLSTVQIGVTVVSLLLGIYGDETFTRKLEVLMDHYDVLRPYATQFSQLIVILIITYLTIFLGELLPKKLALSYPEKIAILLAKPMLIASKISLPFVWILSKSNNFALKVLKIKDVDENIVSEEEIKSIVKESAEVGEILTVESKIVNRVFDIWSRKINTLIVHKSNIHFLDINDNFVTIQNKIKEYKHKIFPVNGKENPNEILGVVFLYDLFQYKFETEFKLSDYIRKPIYIPEYTYAYKLLDILQSKKEEFALVVNEYGEVIGIITKYDIVNSLVVDRTSNDNKEIPQIFQRTDNTWLIDGKFPLAEFSQNFEILEESDLKILTMAGFMINHFNRIPNLGEKFIVEGHELEVIDKDGQRVQKILVTKLN